MRHYRGFHEALLAGAVATIVGANLAQAAGDAGVPLKKQCAAAYDLGQRLRADSKLRAAREQFIICAQEGCPAAIRGECTPWAEQVEASQPSVVIEARDTKGAETAAVRVLVDGVVLVERIGGRAIDVDPGEHLFRFELDDKHLEQKVVIREAEKNRKLQVDFSTLIPRKPAPAASTSAPVPEVPPEPPSASAVPTMTWVFGGVGVVALGSFIAFGITGRNRENDLASTCAPYCPQSDVDAMRQRYLIADISLGVSLLSFGAATWIFLANRGDKTPSATVVGVSPLQSGGLLKVGGEF